MPKTTAGEKIDLYKLHKSDYAASKDPALVNIKPAKYLTIDGQGEPGGPEFQTMLGALYQAAYTMKMAKKSGGQDYKVCTLEGLWWGSVPGQCSTEQPRNTWNWKLIIRVPDFITAADLKSAVAALKQKGKGDLPQKVRLETIKEGRSVQALHVGPYAAEPETVERMRTFAEASGLAFHGTHHEIYLSDPRRVAPERLKTILRMPVE